jgi:GH25 family lysozyme M1 (1,4-beta-N-acetylmuramidase)
VTVTDEILGIDLNVYRPGLDRDDFTKLRDNGCGFVFTRLSLGVDYADPTAQRYMRMAEGMGLVTGVYHYLKDTGLGDDNNIDGMEQAHQFLESIDTLDDQPDFLFLDVEESGIKWGHIVSFVERVRSNFLRIGLYTRETYWEPRFGDKPDIFDYRWYAHYTEDNRWLADWRTPPEQEGKRPDAEFWQFTDDFKWKSPDGKESVDGNVANYATLKQLLQVANPTVTLE